MHSLTGATLKHRERHLDEYKQFKYFCTMDPYQNQRDQLNNTDPNNPRNNSSSENPNRNNATAQQPQHQNAFTIFPPNQTRRNHLQMVAQREEELFQTQREAQRSAPVHMNPEMLGGNVTESEAREQQYKNLRCSKLQKQLKREEEKKRKKEEEERELQKTKNIQREKAEQLEWKRKQEDIRRREQFAEHQSSVNDRFLQKMSSRGAPLKMNKPTPNTSDVPKIKMNLEEQQLEHKRTNAAFLDKIERQMKTLNILGESSSPSQSPPEPICSGHTAGDGETNTASRPDYDWALMKLMNNFPQFDRDVLHDILSQCKGDYEQAYELLSL